MKEQELDQIYTDFSYCLSALGEEEAVRALYRFALLAILEIDDAPRLVELIDRATGARQSMARAPGAHGA
jgi:hypothetical protein